MPLSPLSIPDSPDSQWRISLILAVAVHLFFLLFGVFAPKFFQFGQKLPEVYTVNLYSVEELGPPPAAVPDSPAAAPETVTRAVEAEKPPLPKPAPPKPAPKEKPAASDAVSLHPIKKKGDIDRVKKLRDQFLAEEKAKKIKIEEAEVARARAEAEKARAAADQARLEAEKAARDAARQAVRGLGQSLKAEQQLAVGRAGATSAATGSSGGEKSTALGIYLHGAVKPHIKERWHLPDMQNWKSTLEAVVVIRVRRNGVITNSFFEKKSDNVYFNQFVEKTLRESSPLPPFPVGVDQDDLEIGLKFTPGGVW